MSVPYALYAEKSNNDIKTVNNINDLRAITSYVNKQEVFVKGYYTEGDGGEGFFVFLIDEVEPDTHGIHIKPNNIIESNPGRWVRQYSGPINVKYFGIVKVIDQIQYGPPPIPATQTIISNSQRLNFAIQYVKKFNVSYNRGNPAGIPLKKTSQDMTIYFPSGTYWFTETINLCSNLNIKGDVGTTLSTTTDFEGDYLFKTETGVIEKLNVENFRLEFQQPNPTNPTKIIGGIHLAAIDISGNSTEGGNWTGTFKNIYMYKPTKHGIFLEGQDQPTSGGNEPITSCNQYLHFEDIFVEREFGYFNNCLRITGQNVNLQFESCNFSTPFTNYTTTQQGDSGTNVYIGSTGPTITTQPTQISFINCATGGMPRKSVYNAFHIEKAENINLQNCWFEDTERAIAIKNSKSINIQNCRFANASGGGSNGISDLSVFTIACIDVENSHVNINNNHVTVSDPNANRIKKQLFIFGRGTDNTINAMNNSFQDVRLSESYGITQYVNIENVNTYNSSNSTIPGINTSGKKSILVVVPQNSLPTGIYPSLTTNQIFRINSNIAAGETIFIRADQGSIQFNAWNTVNELMGKNIFLNGKTSLILNNGQSATFIKLDGINGNEKCNYQLVSSSETDDSSWIDITTFSNTTSSFDSNTTVRYRRKNGVVYLDGSIKGGTVQTNGTNYLLFTLPIGYRPNRRMCFPITRANTSLTTSTVGRIEIDLNGNVYGVNYSNLNNSLTGISFLID